MDDIDYDFYDDDDPKVCSLSSSTNPADQELLKELSKDSQYICRTCKRSAKDAEELCSPSLL
jgi:hypothetical protein